MAFTFSFSKPKAVAPVAPAPAPTPVEAPSAPVADANIYFMGLQDFTSEEFMSDYCKGLRYTARPQDEKLRGLIPTWIAEGKIQLIEAYQAVRFSAVQGS